MSRDFILEKLGRNLKSSTPGKRESNARERIQTAASGILPKQPKTPTALVARFIEKAKEAQATVTVCSGNQLPDAVSQWLREHNLPAEIRTGEDKRLSMTIHHRRSPGAEGAVQSLASRLSDEHELWLRPARMSFELHPPVTVDKGTAVHALTSAVEEVESVLFAGDDVGDLAAFASVGELGERGLRTVRVAVVSAETDPRVVDASDLSIDEDEVMTLLDALLAEDRRPEEEVSGG